MSTKQYRTHGLPPRRVSQDEINDLEENSDKILHILPQTRTFDTGATEIECMMVVTEQTVAALGLQEDSWEILKKVSKPDRAFERAFVTQADYQHEEVTKIEDKMESFKNK